LSVDGLSTAHVGTRAVRRGVSESCGRRALARGLRLSTWAPVASAPVHAWAARSSIEES